MVKAKRRRRYDYFRGQALLHLATTSIWLEKNACCKEYYRYQKQTTEFQSELKPESNLFHPRFSKIASTTEGTEVFSVFLFFLLPDA